MKKVVVAHSWSRNMGDAAMLRTIVDIIHAISPDIKITALVSHPEYTVPRCRGIDARIEGWPWPVPQRERNIFDYAVFYPVIYASNMFSALLYRLLGARIFLLNRRFAGPLSSIFECDAFICPGGDFIGPKYFFHSTFGEIVMAMILGKRIIVCAQTIGPFRGAFDRGLASFVLNMADVVIVREGATAKHMMELGVRNVEVTSDLAFMFMAGGHWSRVRKRKVIICPKKISGDRKAYIGGISNLAKRLVDELGYEVEFLASDAYDSDFQSEIASTLGGRVRLAGEVFPPEEIARHMSEAEFVVSSRMHAIILATLSGTPFFAIGDSHKFEAILGSLCDDCTIGIEELDERGIDRILGAIKNGNAIAASIRKKFPQVLAKSMRNAEILKSKFREWGFADGR
jgi:polysaccharide pyruvyl transferase WcaK-like protein